MRRWIVAAALIAALPMAALADDVELDSGEVLRARVLERTAETVVLEHPILGRLEIPAARVIDVRAESEGPPALPEAAPPAPVEPAPPAAPPKPPEPEWKWKLTVGASGETGNGESHNIATAIEGLFKNQRHRWKLRQSWQMEKSDGDRTTNKFRTSVTKDWLIPDSKWFSFAAAVYDWDEFQEWDGRVTVGGGVGYQFVDTDTTSFIGRAGLTGVKETGVSSDRDDTRLELLLGVEGEWKLNASQSIKADTFVLPDLSDGGEYRVISNFTWDIKLNESKNLSLQLGVHNEYDTHTERPFDKNEFEYFIGLQYEF